MKKALNIGKYLLILVAGIAIARFVLFRQNFQSVAVRKISVENRVVKTTISANGEVKSDNEVTLSFPLNGTLISLDVREGDTVEKGESVASLSGSEAYYSLEAAQDNVDIAIRDKELFVENYETNKKAVGGEDEYAIQLRKYNELIEKARATYNSTQQSYYKNFLTAPLTGLVIDTYAKEGETVTLGSPIAKIADPSELIFEIIVDQEDYGQLANGQEVEVELDSYNNVTFKGVIDELPKYANGGDNPNFTIKITLEPSENPALIGMTGDASIITASSENQVSALLYDEVFYDEDDRPYVWTVNESDNLRKEYVEIGLEGDLYTEILTPLDFTVVAPLDADVDIEEGYKANITNE